MNRLAATDQIPHVAICVDQFRSHGRGIMRGIAEYVEIFGPWSLFIDPVADSNYPEGRSKNWHGDGILTYIENAERAERLRRRGVPTVELFAYRLDGKLPLVGNDDIAIGRIAAEHFLERQFKNFAFSGYTNTIWVGRREKGFVDSVRQSGWPDPISLLIRRPKTLAQWETVQQRLTEWVRDLPKPIALMACSDEHAQRILDACQRADVAVPEEAAVLGVDNDEETCRLSNPPLTSVIDDSRRVGYEGARLLDALMRGKVKADELEPMFIPPIGIATRRSTELTAIEDSVVANATRYIREHACRGLTVPELLRQFGISRSALYRRFEDALGRAPHQEILRIQLERVKNLLLQTQMPLEKIAEISGFSNPNYLNVAFKRELEMTPGEFRRTKNPPSAAKNHFNGGFSVRTN